MDFWPLLMTLLVIGAAELGDKTQLLTLGFAAKYTVIEVLSAVSLATAVLMALAVLFGGIINHLIPAFFTQLLAGLLFIFFGASSLLSKDGEEKIKGGKSHNPFFIIFSAFFLAELGDKTQLAAFALSAKYGSPIQVWLGATLGMVAVNAAAALAGSWAKNYISDKLIKLAGAVIFIVFGLVTLIQLLL